jgi:hypothetical protein
MTRPPAAASRGFQILGFDVLLDETLRPYLIEVNHNPSLSVDEELEVPLEAVAIPTAIPTAPSPPTPTTTVALPSPASPHERAWGADSGSGNLGKEWPITTGTKRSSQSARVSEFLVQ